MLVNNGKGAKSIAKEYNIARFTIYKWMSNYNNSGSFKLNDNRGELEKEVINLRKELKKSKLNLPNLDMKYLVDICSKQ